MPFKMGDFIQGFSDQITKGGKNPYFQYFSGMVDFQWGHPIHPSDLACFRDRIGEQGAELIFKVSVELHGKDARQDEIVADTSVQEKAITYPTDAKLYNKVIQWCRRIAQAEEVNQAEEVKLWRSYSRTVPRLMKQQFNAKHPKRRKSARKALKQLKTIAGRLTRELERKLDPSAQEKWQEKLEIP